MPNNNLLAADLPLPLGPTGLTRLIDSYQSTLASLVSAKPVNQGDTGAVPPSLNLNAQMIELAFKYGAAGVFGIAYGLLLGSATGLNQVVSKGHAIMDSLVELPVDTNVVLQDNATNRIWLRNDGTLVVQTTTLPPSGHCVFLGTITTSAGSVSAGYPDTSGVFAIAGGIAARITADNFQPLDAPGVAFPFLTRTLGGLYLWTGASYVAHLGIGAQSPRSFEVTAVATSKTLTRWSSTVQRITPTGAGAKILLPANADITFGHQFEIWNDDAVLHLLVRDHADSITITDLAPGQYVIPRPISSAGSPAWPTSATPTTP